MKHYFLMFKPASSLCNLRCKYCFYSDVSCHRKVHSFGMMQPDIMRACLNSIARCLAPGDNVTLAFQGGEPLLAGLDFYKLVVREVENWDKRIHVEFAVQTNGICIDDTWCRFLKGNNFLVGVSYDLLPACHDDARVDAAGKPTGRSVEQAIKKLNEYKIQYNILCTLTNSIARHPQQAWRRILQLGISYIQFTPCLDDLAQSDTSIYAITPKRFSEFYNPLFRYWLDDYRMGNFHSVKFFDDVISYLAFGVPTSCGMGGHCQPQLVVEADGRVYPCDFYCLDSYKIGSLTDMTPPELLTSSRMQQFLTRKCELPAQCGDCRFYQFCGGGCARMRTCICGNAFCGYADFLERNLPELQKLAAVLKSSWTHQP